MKIRVSHELVYILGAAILSLATAMLAAADFGLSVIVSPAYLVSVKTGLLTFGQAEYVVQGILFILFCIIMRKIKLLYFGAFLSGIIYGFILDLWRTWIPHLNPDIYPTGTLPIQLRIVYFVVGFFINVLGVTLYFKNRYYPQVYEFFVKGVSEKYHIELPKFKLAFDLAFLALSLILTLVMFHKIVAIGVGTLIMACCNGPLIGAYSRWFDKHFELKSR
ncbi:YczE/YyaS/YitT family protein [Sporofaciens sp. SGI.106]|uniref:YczE/YyaS/YitT family protein n=1 Tax=Sporofaciens sp. SGI.106 TaxID=3420568 RepID=UPI003D069A36